MKRRMFAVHVDKSTPVIIDSIAKDFGCKRINGKGVLTGSTGILLDKIAQGKLKIISTNDF